MINKENIIIETFENAELAAKWIKGNNLSKAKNIGNISSKIREAGQLLYGRKTAFGFSWKYVDSGVVAT